MRDGMSKDWEPEIIVFACNWCSYAGADSAGVSRLQYPPSVKLIRTMCSGRVSASLIFEAFRQGAQGVHLSTLAAGLAAGATQAGR